MEIGLCVRYFRLENESFIFPVEKVLGRVTIYSTGFRTITFPTGNIGIPVSGITFTFAIPVVNSLVI
jgi:hypothetical protein